VKITPMKSILSRIKERWMTFWTDPASQYWQGGFGYGLPGELSPTKPQDKGWTETYTDPPKRDGAVLGFYADGTVLVVHRGWHSREGKQMSPPLYWRPLPK
jgi:hypothetical protein